MTDKTDAVGLEVTSKLGDLCLVKSTKVKKGDMLYTTEAIQAAVKEKLEEVAALLDAEASGLSVYRDQVNLVLGFRRMSKDIRALIKQEK